MLMTSPANICLSGPPQHDPFVRLEKVTLTYGRGEKSVQALDATDLAIEKGGFVAGVLRAVPEMQARRLEPLLGLRD